MVTKAIFFTPREQATIDALVQTQSYKEAAKKIHTSEGSLRSTMHRIRIRYDNALTFVKKCDEFQKMLPRKKRYVTG